MHGFPCLEMIFSWESPLDSFFGSKASSLGFAGRVRVGLGWRIKFGQEFPWETTFVLGSPCFEALFPLEVSLGGSFGSENIRFSGVGRFGGQSVQPPPSHTLIKKLSSQAHHLLPPDPGIPTHSPTSKNYNLPLSPSIDPTQYEDQLGPCGSYGLQRADPLKIFSSPLPLTPTPPTHQLQGKIEKEISGPQYKDTHICATTPLTALLPLLLPTPHTTPPSTTLPSFHQNHLDTGQKNPVIAQPQDIKNLNRGIPAPSPQKPQLCPP